MDTTFSIQDLVLHFEEGMRRKDRQNVTGGKGKEPQYPQLIVYLGGGACEAHRSISSNLLRLWPQYRNELKFIGVEAAGEEPDYFELLPESPERRPLSAEGMQDAATALFGTKTHFSDRSELLVYFVLNTSGFTKAEELGAWLETAGRIKELLCVPSSDVLDMLILLLNENHSRQRIASGIKRSLSGLDGGAGWRGSVDTVLLLSNRRSDNAILEDWELCHRIAAAVIALSNNSDAQLARAIFSGGILTASYAAEEKPTREIGQVTVTCLLNKLSEYASKAAARPLDEAGLPARLGLTKKGTFELLDSYAGSALAPQLPSEEQLELFPRADMNAAARLSSMSDGELDEFTMGAWHQYLESIVRRASESIRSKSSPRQEWTEEYRRMLAENFSNDELIYLAEHIEDVVELMSKTRAPRSDARALSAAPEWLRYYLSSDPALTGIFAGAIKRQGREAGELADFWNGLLMSMRRMHDVRDSNITGFYEKLVQNYVDRHGDKLRSGFAAVHGAGELEKFLKNCLEHVIDSDETFSAPFEDELERRLNKRAQPEGANQYIRKKLTGSGVYTYLQTGFSLGEPLASAILLKTGTPLHTNLKNNLPPQTYYYDTGSGASAEAVNIYEVTAENLAEGKE